MEKRFEKSNHPLSLGTVTFLLIAELQNECLRYFSETSVTFSHEFHACCYHRSARRNRRRQLRLQRYFWVLKDIKRS